MVVHFLYRHRIEEDAVEIRRLRARISEANDDRPSKNRMRATESTSIAPQASPHYEPDELAVRVVRLLRIADGKWTTMDQMVRFLEVGSRQDLQVTVKKMKSLGWIEAYRDNSSFVEGSQQYRLGGPGIEFARKNGFKTLIEMEREKEEGR